MSCVRGRDSWARLDVLSFLGGGKSLERFLNVLALMLATFLLVVHHLGREGVRALI